MLNFVVCEDDLTFLDNMKTIINNFMMNYDVEYEIHTFTFFFFTSNAFPDVFFWMTVCFFSFAGTLIFLYVVFVRYTVTFCGWGAVLGAAGAAVAGSALTGTAVGTEVAGPAVDDGWFPSAT